MMLHISGQRDTQFIFSSYVKLLPNDQHSYNYELLCSFQEESYDSLLTKFIAVMQLEGEINIYHVCVGVRFCFTLFSNEGVSTAVGLNTPGVS